MASQGVIPDTKHEQSKDGIFSDTHADTHYVRTQVHLQRVHELLWMLRGRGARPKEAARCVRECLIKLPPS